ncbi:LacI family DNA-binding transcriptional regulator [Anaeromicropila populeti]|uniref:Transcriptional regulator, LacI family n=1 Tax=Anaeromicropila populeti TaxID=37658 RepID=A0A1I6KB14_9FIRM|nr:LacI family DNA-binding transcriptional regulator [Anaeromicropila populeti]SFR88387.1 transcriptional regulator, LacI family [Anaeromicropila populeti]
MATTAKEIARVLQLSEAAVSMALNNKPGVSTETRKMIIETAQNMGYDFTRISKTSENHSIKGNIAFIIYKKYGAVVDDTPFFNQLTESIKQTCQKLRYKLHINYLYGDLESQTDSLSIYDGILLLATEMKKEDFGSFSKLKTPIVVLDTYLQSLDYDCVLINNFQGAYQAAMYLVEQTRTQPGYLHSSYSIGNFDERADGFFKAIRDCGMSLSNSQILALTPSLSGAYHDMLIQLNQGVIPFCGYFADNDYIAAGAMKALHEMGYQIPEDVSVVGFDNLPFSNVLVPSLTTINVPKQYMGEVSVERLVQNISSPKKPPIKIQISTSLIKRKSVANNTRNSIVQ